MNISQFLIMRHEMLLTIAAVIMLVAEIATSDKNKKKLIPFFIGMFAVVTIAGFLPGETGTLFGGSYQANSLTIVMKNVLNIGALIIFLQAEGWLYLFCERNGFQNFACSLPLLDRRCV